METRDYINQLRDKFDAIAGDVPKQAADELFERVLAEGIKRALLDADALFETESDRETIEGLAAEEGPMAAITWVATNIPEFANLLELHLTTHLEELLTLSKLTGGGEA